MYINFFHDGLLLFYYSAAPAVTFSDAEPCSGNDLWYHSLRRSSNNICITKKFDFPPVFSCSDINTNQIIEIN